MTDVVDAVTRSKMMAAIKGKNTRPELIIRKALHARGYRFRLHNKAVIGKPDIVLTKYKTVIFINGCFWHQHDCHLFKWPKSRVEFWKQKIGGNKTRDIANYERLFGLGWKIIVVWECALKGRTKLDLGKLLDKIDKMICSKKPINYIEGKR